jgi:hypothetical protein
MKRLFLVAFLFPIAAHAQQPPPQFCMPQSTAQAVGAAFQAGTAAMALLQEAATEPQRQAAAVAAAVAKQKADDEAKSAPSPTPGPASKP